MHDAARLETVSGRRGRGRDVDRRRRGRRVFVVEDGGAASGERLGRWRRAATAGAARLKDVTDVAGVRENQLYGYGLVVGLAGTGDSLRNSPFTKQSLESMLERLGVQTRGAPVDTKNVAAVMVTATLPPLAMSSSRL